MYQKLLHYHSETFQHSARVAHLTIIFGEFIGLRNKQLDRLFQSAFLHDVGKLMVDLSILEKREKLNSEEFNQIHLHPLLGSSFLLTHEIPRSVVTAVMEHHENFDGSGYPFKKKGNRIHFYARIIRIIDSFDVLIGGRFYQKPVSPLEAIQDLKQKSEWYDPSLLLQFEFFIKKYKEYQSFTADRSFIYHQKGVKQYYE